MTGSRPRRSAREAVLDAAAWVLAENPGASMSAVAEAAGVGRATLYRYFPSREALVRELALEAIERTDAAVAPVFEQGLNSEDSLLGMLEAIVPLGDRYHFLATERIEDQEFAEQIRRQARETAELVEQAKKDGLFASGLPTAWIVAAIDALIWAAWDTVREGTVAPRDAASLAFKTLTRGLAPEGEGRASTPASNGRSR